MSKLTLPYWHLREPEQSEVYVRLQLDQPVLTGQQEGKAISVQYRYASARLAP